MSDVTESVRHWADAAARDIAARAAAEPVVCTGISPSGPFHVGHLREIITGDAVTRALRDAGRRARLLFVVDNLDPLRKVYPFLDPAVYEQHVGRPLCEIPAPAGEGTYDEHFLAPFLEALARLRVEAEVVRASALYASGRMDDVVFTALERRDLVARILAEVTGRVVDDDWSPWTPRCGACDRLDCGRVLSADRSAGLIVSECGACGARSEAPPARGGKLTWRVDWPARWSALGVDAEPFGKDHATRGGSYDSGRRLAAEVFGREAPFPILYEWIALQGRGDMSSSRGNVLSVTDLVDVVPPEALRYFVLRSRPSRSISFDPGLPLLRLVDEVDDASAQKRDDRALELSRAAGFRPVGVPFHHLVLVAQIADFDLDGVLRILARGGYGGLDRGAVAERLRMARAWLDRFAPEDARVELKDELPEAARTLDADQRAFLADLAARLPGLSDPKQIHDAIHAAATADAGPGAKRGFQALYRALLGRERGPRAGFFLAALDPEFVDRRLREAAAAP